MGAQKGREGEGSRRVGRPRTVGCQNFALFVPSRLKFHSLCSFFSGRLLVEFRLCFRGFWGDAGKFSKWLLTFSEVKREVAQSIVKLFLTFCKVKSGNGGFFNGRRPTSSSKDSSKSSKQQKAAIARAAAAAQRSRSSTQNRKSKAAETNKQQKKHKQQTKQRKMHQKDQQKHHKLK